MQENLLFYKMKTKIKHIYKGTLDQELGHFQLPTKAIK